MAPSRAPVPPTPFWTADIDREARRLWRAGLSARQVAEATGAASASAVLGRARRRAWRRPAEIARQNHRFAHPVFTDRTFPLPGAPPLELAANPRPWLERRAGQCAFPVDGESWDTRSCCNPSGAHTYCEAHRAVMRGPATGSAEQLARAVARHLA
ncbi:MAG: GcrA family cell cycle regulator [Caulobacteraceae bacterium]